MTQLTSVFCTAFRNALHMRPLMVTAGDGVFQRHRALHGHGHDPNRGNFLLRHHRDLWGEQRAGIVAGFSRGNCASTRRSTNWHPVQAFLLPSSSANLFCADWSRSEHLLLGTRRRLHYHCLRPNPRHGTIWYLRWRQRHGGPALREAEDSCLQPAVHGLRIQHCTHVPPCRVLSCRVITETTSVTTLDYFTCWPPSTLYSFLFGHGSSFQAGDAAHRQLKSEKKIFGGC